MRFAHALLIVIAITVIGGCGMGSDQHERLNQQTAKQPFSISILEDSFVGGASIANCRTQVVETGNLISVDILVEQAKGLKAFYAELTFDPQLHSFVNAEPADSLSDAHDYLSLAIPTNDGLLHYGHVLANFDEREGLTGNHIVATMSFRLRQPGEPAPTLARAVSAVPTSESAKVYPGLIDGEDLLFWHYRNTGDYDQNGEVNIGDLTPLGANINLGVVWLPNSARDVIDGDDNGEINIADITPIGVNFGNFIAGYHVMASANEADYPSSAASPQAIPPLGMVQVSQAQGSKQLERLSFGFQVPTPIAGDYYWVRPTDGTDLGIPSALTGGPGVGKLVLSLANTTQQWPHSGAGTIADPYLVNPFPHCDLWLKHSVDGNVSSSSDSSYFIQPVVGSVEPFADVGMFVCEFDQTNSITTHATYKKSTSNRLYFEPNPDATDIEFSIDTNTNPISGAGTATDPWIIDYAQTYKLRVLQIPAPPVEITDQCTFTPVNLLSPVAADGTITIGPGALDSFSISAEYQGTPTTPPVRYFQSNATGPTLTLSLDGTAGWPFTGSGTQADPYVIKRLELFIPDLIHSEQGGVGSLPGAIFTFSDPAIPADSDGAFMAIPSTNDFTMFGTYDSLTSNTIYFSVQGTETVTFEQDSGGSQPSAGTGTQADPYVVEADKSYTYKTMHSRAGDVTGVTSFTSSDPAKATASSGSPTLDVLAGASGAFDVAAKYFGKGPTTPEKLYYTIGDELLLELDATQGAIPAGGIGTAADPFQIRTNASYRLVVTHPVDGDVTLSCLFTPAYLVGANMNLPQGTTDFNLSATYDTAVSNELVFEVIGHNEPPNATFTLTPSGGDIPLDVVADMSGSSDPDGSLASWDWRLDGKIVGNLNVNQELSFMTPGTYDLNLTVYDYEGAYGTHSANILVQNTTGRSWHVDQISGFGINGCSVSYWVDGVDLKPTVAISDTGFVDFLYSTDLTGSTFNEVQYIDGQDLNFTNYSDVVLSEYYGTPMAFCVCRDFALDTDVVRYMVATVGDPQTWSTHISVNTNVLRGEMIPSLSNNVLYIYHALADNSLTYFSSADSGATWVPGTSFGTTSNDSPSMTMGIHGNPCIAYATADSVRITTATTTDGTTWTNDSLVQTPCMPTGVRLLYGTGAANVIYADVTAIGGNEAYLWSYQMEAGDQTVASYAPIKTADWDIERSLGATLVNGKPAIVFQDSTGIYYMRAHTSDGSSWDAPMLLMVTDSRNPSMIELNGRPCIAFNTTADSGASSSGTFFATFF